MRFGTSDRSELPAAAVTYEQKMQGIAMAREAGHLIFSCGKFPIGTQTVTVNPHDTTDMNLWFDWMEASQEMGGEVSSYDFYHGRIAIADYAGLKRPRGLLRRAVYFDVSPEHAQEGDRIAFHIGNDVHFSNRVREISSHPALEVVEHQLHVPKLALSAE